MCRVHSARRTGRHGTIVISDAIRREAVAANAGGAAVAPSHTLASERASREIEVTTSIEDHGATGDIPSDKLPGAGDPMFKARLICYEGRVRLLYNNAAPAHGVRAPPAHRRVAAQRGRPLWRQRTVPVGTNGAARSSLTLHVILRRNDRRRRASKSNGHFQPGPNEKGRGET